MTCREIQNLLPGYWENHLSEEERRLIESHLTLCSQCRRTLIDLKETENLLNHLDEVVPPPFFEQSIMSRIREEAGEKKSFLQRIFFPIHIKIPLQAMATLLIAVLAVYIYQKNEPEMRPMISFSTPRREQPQKSFQAPGSSQSVKIPDLTNKVEPNKPSQLSKTPLPSSPAAGGAFPKKDQSPFAAAPPTISRSGVGDSVELTRPKEDEKSASEKAGSPLGALREREAFVQKPAMGRPRVEEQEIPRAIDAPEKEGKKKSEVADKGTVEKRAQLRSAPAPASSMGAKTGQQTAIDIDLQVKDPNQALRQIEEYLNQMGAQIKEKMEGAGSAFLKAEMSSKKLPLLLHYIESVGRISSSPGNLKVNEGVATISIHIFSNP